MIMIPTEWQKGAIRTTLESDKPVIMAGAIRSGKTLAAGMAMLLHGASRQGTYIIGGRTYTTALRNIILPMLEICRGWRLPHKLIRSEQKLRAGKSEYLIFGASTEASQDNIQGMTADGFLLDELPLLPKSFLMQAIARCSNDGALMIATLNKTNPNHWVKTEIVDSGEVEVIESMIDDNPHISEKVKSRYAKLLTGHYGARMLANEWAAATGRIWPDLMTIANLPIPLHGGIVAMDAAQSGTTAALRMAQIGGKWIIVGEYRYEGERPFHVHAAMVAAWKPSLVIVDPSSPGLIAAIRRTGTPCIPAPNRVLDGIHATETAIRTKRILLAEGQAPSLEKEMQSYVWDEKAAMIGEDKPLKTQDHFCDCLRYFCLAKLPMASLIPTQKGAGL